MKQAIVTSVAALLALGALLLPVSWWLGFGARAAEQRAG